MTHRDFSEMAERLAGKIYLRYEKGAYQIISKENATQAITQALQQAYAMAVEDGAKVCDQHAFEGEYFAKKIRALAPATPDGKKYEEN